MLTATGIDIEIGEDETVATFPYVVTEDQRAVQERLLGALVEIRPNTEIEWVSMRKVVLTTRQTMSEHILLIAAQFQSRAMAASYLAQALIECKANGVHHREMEAIRRRYLWLSGHKTLALPAAGQA